ncbi:MAG: J domain-containing protein [Notoacmeibacter sp.]
MHKELSLLGGVSNLIITSNQPIGRNGGYVAGKPDDNDYGVAIYFNRKGVSTVMARDAFYPNADNIWSIALAVEAMRALARNGGEGLMGKAFVGMAALPPPKPWWEILSVANDAPLAVVEAVYRKLVKTLHPDRGGNANKWQELQSAINAARSER